MYSYEIKLFLDERNHVLSREEFLELTDVQKNPQIKSMKYDTSNDNYEIVTSDGYYFTFIKTRKNTRDFSHEMNCVK